MNPATGDFAMPTIGTFIQLLPEGYATRPYRATDGTVFVVVEGEGVWTVVNGDPAAARKALDSSERELEKLEEKFGR